MELVANIWPIVDGITGIVQRFAARAYCMDALDETISVTLRALADSDYVLARQYLIPERFAIVSEHGKATGVVTPADFNEYQDLIVEPALRDLESDWPPLQGIAMGHQGEPRHEHIRLTFPQRPYLVVTFIREDEHGKLVILRPQRWTS